MNNHQPQREASHRDHVVLYAVLAGLLAGLAIAGAFTYGYEQRTEAAEAKAVQLEQRWSAIGLRAPANRDVLTRLYGVDGGAVCDTSGHALTEALLRTALANGAAGPGQRAVIVDKDVVAGERAVVAVYCPDRLDDFDEFINGLTFDDVVRDA
jgi:hypothetical protein